MEVTLLDSMGSDLSVVNAARVSMHKETTEFRPKDAGLINYLAKHGHFTPFTQVTLQFRIQMPIFVARQWFKHQVGFTRNEVSRRYVDEPPAFYEPQVWRSRAENVKQGSSEKPVENQRYLREGYEKLINASRDLYGVFIDSGVAPEQARMVLPQSMLTEFIETGSLYAYARLCKLRLDSHAQKETQAFAEIINRTCEQIAPVSWASLMKY